MIQAKQDNRYNTVSGQAIRVILSNIPGFMLARELKRGPVRRWVYFGAHHHVLERLKHAVGETAEQIDYGEKLYGFTKAQRNHFIQWIDQVASRCIDKKEWLFSVPAVKNTFTSNLFLYTCYVFVLEDMIQKGETIDLIFVDSSALAAVFEDSFSGRIIVSPANKWLKVMFRLRVFVKSVLRFGKYLIDFARKFISAKLVLRNRGRHLLKGKKDIILIRNFITNQFSDTQEDILERHFFPGLYDYLQENGHTPVFVPIIASTSNYRHLFREVFKSKKNIIFPEEFLKLQDYLYAFLAPWRALRLRLFSPCYGRYQLERLLKEEYYANLTEFGFLYATLLSCLGKRFRENGLSPQGIINWMENQAFEKGFIKGFRENFPDARLIGSQPVFIPANYLSMVSSEQEKRSGLLPDKVLVLGPAGKSYMTEFIKDVNIGYSPAFRYASALLDHPAHDQKNNLLVLLGYNLENAVHIMRTLSKIKGHLESFDHVMVKLHPAGYFDEMKLSKAVGGRDVLERYSFVNGRLEQYMDKVSVGLCGASGTAVELVMRGVPVIIVGDPQALTMDYLVYKEDRDMWQICFSTGQIIKTLERFKLLKEERSHDLIQKAREFRDAFITQPDEKHWENYLIKA
jgi:hypothetical protein